MLFIERGLMLLRSEGRLGFIVPSTFLKLDYGRRLRARLGHDRAVETIVDFGHAQMFEGATNYTCILILDRAGVPELTFTAVKGMSADVRRAVASRELPDAEHYATSELGSDPWLLVGRKERAIIDSMRAAGSPLSAVTSGVFTGVQTSADPIYILEDVCVRDGRRVLIEGDGREVELEPDLLHPLASGSDVERYALRTLRSVLLFPYRRRDGRMELVSEDELRALPRTWDYLQRHEAELRSREKGKMDHNGWWGYNYPKSLGLHEHPKLGVAATVQRLEVAADPAGAAYFHNVRVNGILPRDGTLGLFALLAVLNSRPVDFAFRRGAAPLQNGFFTANKQFISWLPIPEPPSELGQHGKRLYELATAIDQERSTFLDWLTSVCGTPLKKLNGWTKLEAYARQGLVAALDVLDANASRLKIDPRSRAHRERISAELDSSAARIVEQSAQLQRLEREVDVLIAEAYALTSAQRARVDSEYK